MKNVKKSINIDIFIIIIIIIFRATIVAEIMTPNPMCVTASTSAQDALNLMVSRGFRHLVNLRLLKTLSLLL